MRVLFITSIIFVLIVSISITSISAQEKYQIPSWVKGVAGFWAEGTINDQDFGDAISFLITEKIIKIPEKLQTEEKSTIENYNLKLKDQISMLKDENMQLQEEISQLENNISQLENDKSELRNSLTVSDGNLDEALDEMNQLQEEISDLKKSNDSDVDEIEPSITVEVDRLQAYREGDLVIISGNIINAEGIAVSLEIINPDKNTIFKDKISPRSNESFNTSFTMRDASYDEFGKYIVRVEYGSVEAETFLWYNPN